MADIYAYLGLFTAAFAAATLLPLQSEALLIGLLLGSVQPAWALVLAASLGNVLGSLVNWWLGRYLERFRDRRWFPVSDRRLQQAQHWYGHYGRWSLLLSWLPVIGDPLTLVAGIMREPLWRFMLIVTFAKTLRYTVLAAATLGLSL
ncbi:YqaA family protein [Phytopseudomonas punonensis]|uniref:Membrane protein YqaA, SNARE-associated domain n=1 Tax=Phytopseudomonas punonensis TaxID=1220495 RepID=A0A1M7HGP7_9GAMM|nr:YqaA family protein [Pseudomonas punonensis]SHM27665.1 membrane protein YqaA, SNARE-associated domain [Pseudomonas punonensis]